MLRLWLEISGYLLRISSMWVASPWGFSEKTIQPARHECYACCLLRAGFLAFQPVVDNTRGTRVEQVVSSFQKILRGSQLTCTDSTNSSLECMFSYSLLNILDWKDSILHLCKKCFLLIKEKKNSIFILKIFFIKANVGVRYKKAFHIKRTGYLRRGRVCWHASSDTGLKLRPLTNLRGKSNLTP